MNWRRIINVLGPIVLAIYCVRFIIDDRALLAAGCAFVLAGNLSFDLVEWADKRKNIGAQGER